MATQFVNFAGADQNPWTSIPVGWTIRNGSFRRFSSYGLGEIVGIPYGIMTFDTYAAGLRSITAPMRWNSGTSSSSEFSLVFVNAVRTGFAVHIKNASITILKLVAGANSTVIATLSTTNTANASFTLEFNDTSGAITVKKDGASVLTGNYTDTPNLLAGFASYNASIAQSLANITVEYTPAQTIDTLTTPLTVGSAFSGTCTGFADGAATLSGGGVSIPVTIASGAFSATFPALTDNTVFPVLPATGILWTLTQSALSAGIVRDLNLPTNFDVTRNGSTPSNFVGLITDDSTYLGYHFLASGNALTTNDRCYWDKQTVSSESIVVGLDGGLSIPVALLPLTFPLYVHRGSDGKVYSHSISVTEAGAITVSAGVTHYSIGFGLGIGI